MLLDFLVIIFMISTSCRPPIVEIIWISDLVRVLITFRLMV